MFATMTLIPTDHNPTFCNLEKRTDLFGYKEILRKWTHNNISTLESKLKQKPKPIMKEIYMTYNNESLVLPLRLTLKSIEKALMEAFLPEESKLSSNEYLNIFLLDMREVRIRMEEEGGGGSINDLSLGDLFMAGRNNGKISIKVFLEESKRKEEEKRIRSEKGVKKEEGEGRREESLGRRDDGGGKREDVGGKKEEGRGGGRKDESIGRREEGEKKMEEEVRRIEEGTRTKEEEEAKRKVGEEERRRRMRGRKDLGRRTKEGGGCLGLYYYGYQCSEWMDCKVKKKIMVKKEGESGKGELKYYQVVFGMDKGGKKLILSCFLYEL